MVTTLEVFFSYAHADEEWRNKLEKHLGSLKRQRLITAWHDRKIVPGAEWAPEIDAHLRTAHLILLLISPDFISSDYCWGVELKQAIKKHKAGGACVIPIIVRPVDWKHTPFAKLQALPPDGKAITTWFNSDEALAQVAQGIRNAVEAERKKRAASSSTPASTRSSNRQRLSLSPKVWNVPFRRNPFFTGRETILEHVHTMLTTDYAAALAQPPAISGLGGIGKTQTAVEYAYRYSVEYKAVFWVRSDTREEFVADLVTIAGLLNLQKKNEQDQHLAIYAVKKWFETNREWLLIFDNADDLTLVRDYLPLGNIGHILLTTRAQAMSGLARKVEINTMEPEEGALFLLRRAGILEPKATLDQSSVADHAKAVTIVHAMDGLPLALDQAGAYLEETGESLSGYLSLYYKQRNNLLKRRGGLTPDHPLPVATTWSLSFEKVEQANQAAVELLQLCAFLAPDAIPEEMITGGTNELGPILRPIAADPGELNTAIGELLKYSLLRRDPMLHQLTIHRLVQAVLKDGMSRSAQRRWAERAVRAVSRAFPEVDVATWPQCQLYLPQAQICVDIIGQHKFAFPEAAQLLNRAGRYLEERGQYSEAEPFYQRALAIHEKALGLEHSETATTLNNLAVLNYRLGRYEQAESLCQRALAICERVLGPEHALIATTLNNLAAIYRDPTQRKYEQAESLCQRALAIHEKALGLEHSETATTLNNLAGIYFFQLKYEQAELLYQRALAIREKVLGPEHPETATTLSNLASLYDQQGQYEQAEPFYQRALAIREKVLGPEHPQTAVILYNLALFYDQQGQYEQAKALSLRALAIREKVLGPEHPQTASSLGILAWTYDQQGQYEQAEPFYQRALAIREKVLGPEHPETTKILNNLVWLYKGYQGQYAKAKPLFQRAIGSDHMKPLETMIADKGNEPDAVTLVRQQFAESEVFALGSPAGDISLFGQGTEGDLLHFTVDDSNGVERVMLPVFTRTNIMKLALLRNSEWQSVSILQVDGRALLENIDHDVTFVINPWSPLEFQLPRQQDRAAIKLEVPLQEQGDIEGANVGYRQTSAIVHLRGAAELEAFITMKGDNPVHDDAVRRRVVEAQVLALGAPTQSASGKAHLLHCTVPGGDTTIAMLPVFTRLEHVMAAVKMNPAWQSLQVLQMEGSVVLGDLEEGEWLGINPWSGHEFKLPPNVH